MVASEMSWEDRDRARFGGEERRAPSGASPQGSFWSRPVAAGQALGLVAVLLVAALALGALGALGHSPPRSGEAYQGRPPAASPPTVGSAAVKTWPGGVIRYANGAPDQEWAVQQAAAAWNASGARVRFVEVPPSQAELTIAHTGSSSCDQAEATVGAVSSPRVWIFPRNDADPLCSPYAAAVALAHEFGHVLGLTHVSDQCAAMNPAGSYRGPQDCAQLDPWLWYCRMLEPVDVERAVALYGGEIGLGAERGCSLYTPIAPPSGLHVEPAGAGPGAIEAVFGRPTEPSVPLFLQSRLGPPAFSAVLSAGSCPDRPSDQRYRWSGDLQTVTFSGRPPGRYCLEVWAYDGLGRPSSAPSRLLVDVAG
jgi:hypothetical protein